MKIGQISVIVFAARLLGAALGFIATLAFARIVGAEILGVYILILTIVSWIVLASDLGIGGAIKKRISENEEPGAYLTAGVIWILFISITGSIGLLFVQPVIEEYIGEFNHHISVSVIWVVICLLFIKLFYKTPAYILEGERKVYIAALLNPIKEGGRSILQICFVVLGYGLLGMLVGYAIGGIIVGFVAIYFISIRTSTPEIRHFKSLFNYAKYSWLGRLRSRIFQDVDILILGVFAPSAAVGVYSVAWSLSRFLELFSSAIASTLFPEISYKSKQGESSTVQQYIEDALTYSGLFIIPGFIGGLLISEELMSIYGPEFMNGSDILWLLILAILIYSYQKQFITALNAIDRPDLSFRANLSFAVINTGLNIVLIPLYGIRGAAIASVISVSTALFIAYYYIRKLITFDLQSNEIMRQVISALLMGLVVLFAQYVFGSTNILRRNLSIVIVLVVGGATIYFLCLSVISSQFRRTVRNNTPSILQNILRHIERK